MTNQVNVRLTEQQVTDIITAISDLTINMPMQLYLYGSRADLNAKGGDIDLLLLCGSCAEKQSLHAKKHILLASIKSKLGDQKIDILIDTQASLSSDPFLKIIIPQAVLLYQQS